MAIPLPRLWPLGNYFLPGHLIILQRPKIESFGSKIASHEGATKKKYLVAFDLRHRMSRSVGWYCADVYLTYFELNSILRFLY